MQLQTQLLKPSASSLEISSLRDLCDVVSAMDATFSEDSLAPSHRPIPHSVLSTPFQQMTSKEMVRLNILDKVIINLPEVTPTTPAAWVKVLTEINAKMEKVILLSCTDIMPGERSKQLVVLKRRHRLPGKKKSHEYAVPVKKYGEREQIQVGYLVSDLNCLWRDNGFRIIVEPCGYDQRTLAMIRVKYVPYIQIYKRPILERRDRI